MGEIEEIVPPGSTPLEQDELDEILVPGVLTRGDLNRIEQLNIDDALRQLESMRLSPARICSVEFARDLHKRMFGDVWRWAGKYRSTMKTLGVDPGEISPAMHNCVADASLWVESSGDWTPDEIAVRFGHRLVFIHPFPNGNGRWSRELSSLLAVALGVARFTWGSRSLDEISETRSRYISAVHDADDGNFEPLLKFSRE